MKLSRCLFTWILTISIFQVFCQSPQQKNAPVSSTIELTDIPIRSVQMVTEARQTLQDLISKEAIRKMWVQNTITLYSIDTNILRPINPNDPMVNLRFLENRRILLELEQNKVEEEEGRLNGVIVHLDTLTNWLNEEIALWKNTYQVISKDTLSKPLISKITYTISYLDSSQRVVNAKLEQLMGMLENTIAIGVNIDLQLERTQSLIKKKEQNSLSSDHAPFFSMQFKRDYFTELAKSWQDLRQYKLMELGQYLEVHSSITLFVLIYFLVLFWFFRKIKHKIRLNMEGYGLFYKRMFLSMLSRPLEVSIILTIILTAFIYPDRPLTFRELQVYLVSIPLIVLLNKILDRVYLVYLVGFIGIIVIYMVLLLLSTDTVLYRVMLLVIALIEAGLMTLLIIRIGAHLDIRHKVKNGVRIFLGILLALSLIGFVANLTGRVILAELTIHAVFINIFISVSMFVSALLLNGVIVSVVDSYKGRKLNAFQQYGENIKIRVTKIVNGLAFIYLFFLVMYAFQLDVIVLSALKGILTYKFVIGTASFSLDFVLVFFLVLIVSVYLGSFIQILLEKDLLNRMSLSKGLPHTISMAIKYVIIVLGFLLAVNTTGIPMDKLAIILGAFSVGIGFGLQNIFNNMVSGLILLFERPIQLGDTVQVGDLIGSVKSIDLRSSNIHTFDGAEVIVPNGQLVSNEVINWTLSDQKRRLEIPVGVGYESDPKVVHRLLMTILHENKDVLQDPEPNVFFSGLGESSLDFMVVFWIPDYNLGRIVKSAILFEIFRILNENNIKIPFPQREIHINTPNK